MYEKEHRYLLPLDKAGRVILGNFEQKHKEALEIILNNYKKHFRDDYYQEIDLSTIVEQKKESSQHIIHLDRIEKPEMRNDIGRYLASFSKDPSYIFLFKIRQPMIQSVIKGLNCQTDYTQKDMSFARYSRWFEVLETEVDVDRYNLKFKPAKPKPTE